MDDRSTSSNEKAPSSRATLLDLLTEMRERDRLLQEYIETRSKIHSRWTTLIGIIAVIAGLWMSQLIHQMMDDMAIMSGNMATMEGYMGSMKGDMGSMNQSMSHMEDAIVPMRGYMETMSIDIASVPKMQKDVNHMANSVGRMQYDTGIMRHGVANMSNDMGNMSHPFNVLNSITPW